ncbi:MAG: CRISPR-associated endonuclease Cas2 [Planctomycetaceae bacterium]|nr:CRISPR-associated endonuclease Cas2 [Planctomycetaceae bacterium]
MWLFAMFDLPVKEKKQRKAYARFRNLLLNEGFDQLQYSVYARVCASEQVAGTIQAKLEAQLPPDGHVRLLAVTDRQFGKMQVFYGKNRGKPEGKPSQLQLF